MSAIVGLYDINFERIPHEYAARLLQALSTYEADYTDTWNNGYVLLGCHALLVAPESVNERLPRYDEQRQLAIAADAMIDNREELLDMLQVDRGQRVMMPDSELLLCAYVRWGEKMLHHLIGDFAFIIWDERERKLFAARDCSGTRTLYYCQEGHRFSFCTTMKPLLQLPGISSTISEDWMAQFLAIPGMAEAVDPQLTVYRQIRQIPPSHSLTITSQGLRLTPYRPITDWDQEELRLGSDEAYIEAFQDVFQRAVADRLRTRGEVGAHLSGGLDSGTVASFAARQLLSRNKRLHTYSSIPEDSYVDWAPRYYVSDERPYIGQTVEHTGNMDARYLDFAGRSPYTEIDNMLSVMEMPYKFFENAYWLAGIFEKAREQGVKVLLSGARGNHSISWGSRALSMEYYAGLLRKLQWVRLYHELDRFCEHYQSGKSYLLPQVARKALPGWMRRLAGYESRRGDVFRPLTLIRPELATRTQVYDRLAEYGVLMGDSVPGRMRDYRLRHYEHPYVWNKSGVATTKLSLRHGLWDRDPTNDLRVIRFCLSLPEEQYVQGGMERSFIRRATRGILPDQVRLNVGARGLQGADTIHRMSPHWPDFLAELDQMSRDPVMVEWLDMQTVRDTMDRLGREARPELLFREEFKQLTRGLVVYRFMRSLEGR